MTEFFGILYGGLTIYLMWQQNRILKKQNEIFARQEGTDIALNKTDDANYRKYWPLFAMAALMVLTWAAVGVGYYDRHSSQTYIPEFDESRAGIYYSYGPSSLGCEVDANGDAFWEYREKFRIAAACIYFDAVHDHLDTPYLQVGEEHDITKGHMPMTVVVAEKMRPAIYVHGMNFLILLIPKDVVTSQFTTLRSARALGVKIKMAGSK